MSRAQDIAVPQQQSQYTALVELNGTFSIYSPSTRGEAQECSRFSSILRAINVVDQLGLGERSSGISRDTDLPPDGVMQDIRAHIDLLHIGSWTLVPEQASD
ncbi:hypothetical protein TWF281_005798 [Arthrobotrys megalospora]